MKMYLNLLFLLFSLFISSDSKKVGRFFYSEGMKKFNMQNAEKYVEVFYRILNRTTYAVLPDVEDLENCPTDGMYMILNGKLKHCLNGRMEAAISKIPNVTLDFCVSNAIVPSPNFMVILKDGSCHTHIFDMYRHIEDAACFIQMKVVVTEMISVNKKLTHLSKITELNSTQLGYIDLCSTINLFKKILYTNCDIKLTIIILYTPIFICLTIMFIILAYILKKWKITKKEEIGLIRYEDWNGKKIIRKSKYSATNNTRKVKRTITFLCITLSLPCIKSCDQVPVIKADINVCGEHFKLCNGKEFLQVDYYSSGQSACLSLNDSLVEVVNYDIKYHCEITLSYYTPTGILKIDEDYICDGYGCDDGDLENKKWNQINRRHSGGWFHGCWGWGDQCHVLNFNIHQLKMCEVLKCRDVRKIHSLKVVIDGNAVDIDIEEGIPKIYKNMTFLIIPNQLVNYGEDFLRCNKDIYKISANPINYHDIDRIGFIQCPTNNLTNKCTAKFDSLYKLDYDNNLINTVDLTYKSQLMQIDNIDSTIHLDLNYMTDLRVIIISNKTLNHMIVTTDMTIEELRISGELFKENGAIITYKCSKQGVTFQFKCPMGLRFSLSCDVVGVNNKVLSFISTRSKSQFPCFIIDSLGNEATIYVELNVTMPKIDLLQVDNNPNFADEHHGLFNWKFNGVMLDLFRQHFIAVMVLVAWIALLVIKEIHNAFK